MLKSTEKKELTTKIIICWLEVIEANLNQNDENIVYHINFAKLNDSFRTEFQNYSFGFDGFIISKSVEIISVEIPN